MPETSISLPHSVYNNRKKMANIFRKKNFYLCFSKIKCLPTNQTFEEEEEEDFDHNNVVPIKIRKTNFNSLYDFSSTSNSTDDYFFSSSDDSDDNSDSIPDFSTVFASRRFFFSSPGNSNSIVESPATVRRLTEEDESDAGIVSGGVAIQTYSPDPFADFRRSMQEMVDDHELKGLKADWDFLHELLLCYLKLNPKQTHKFIIGAFTDLIVSNSMSSTTVESGGRSTDDHHLKCSTTSRLFV